MDYFFGFETRLTERVNYVFTLNHLFLLFIVLGLIFALYFGLHAKSEKGKMITKLVLASVLLVFEIGRIVYKYIGHSVSGGTFANFDWWWNISFQLCAIACWATIVTLFLSAFLKKENNYLKILYNILFGMALVGAALAFVYPDTIKGDRSLLHFENVQTILVHVLIIFVPIYLIKVKELNIRLKNIWMPAFGFLIAGSISMSASQISGQNFGFALSNGLLHDIGIRLPFPWHMPVTLFGVFLITLAMYGIFELVYFLKNRKNKVEKDERSKICWNKFYILFIVTMSIGSVLSSLAYLTIPMMFNATPAISWIGLLCLFPIPMIIGSLYLGFWFKRRAVNL